jgi:formylglycine-generating enzyme required for sulfatase activity
VGSYPSNAFGLFDMHGNVSEWCEDRFQRDYYKEAPTKDPTGPNSGEGRVVRGGSEYDKMWGCKSATRWGAAPYRRNHRIGFRVACALLSRGQ